MNQWEFKSSGYPPLSSSPTLISSDENLKKLYVYVLVSNSLHVNVYDVIVASTRGSFRLDLTP